MIYWYCDDDKAIMCFFHMQEVIHSEHEVNTTDAVSSEIRDINEKIKEIADEIGENKLQIEEIKSKEQLDHDLLLEFVKENNHLREKENLLKKAEHLQEQAEHRQEKAEHLHNELPCQSGKFVVITFSINYILS
jgi:chromosome segregation ATPase